MVCLYWLHRTLPWPATRAKILTRRRSWADRLILCKRVIDRGHLFFSPFCHLKGDPEQVSWEFGDVAWHVKCLLHSFSGVGFCSSQCLLLLSLAIQCFCWRLRSFSFDDDHGDELRFFAGGSRGLLPQALRAATCVFAICSRLTFLAAARKQGPRTHSR